MELQLEAFRHGDQVVLRATGRLNGTTAQHLEHWLLAHGEPGPALWDIGTLHYVSSAGLRVLLAHEKRRRKAGAASTVLVGLQPAVREVLAITGLADFWPLLAELPAAQEPVATLKVVAPEESSASGTLVRWQQAGGTAASLADLRVAFGQGGLGSRRVVAAANPVDFLSLPGVLAVRHADGETDSLPVKDPSTRFVRLQEAWALAGAPAQVLDLQEPATREQLHARLAAEFPAHWFGVLAVSPGVSLEATTALAKAARVSLSVLPPPTTSELPAGCFLPVSGLDFAALDGAVALDSALEVLAAAIGEGLQAQAAEAYPAGTRLWVWATPAPVPEMEHGLTLDAAEADDETELLVRTLYADCRHVQLARLSGGFSAATWLVTSHDAAGRQHLPTVLKVGPPTMMNRENAAHERYVRPFILNNASVALGSATQGDSVGLRYNFVGITGDSQSLQTLMRRWNGGEGSAVTELFGQLARHTLRPWYGQTRWQNARLYADHTPLRLFSGLLGVARDFLTFDLQQPRLYCPALGRSLPNPWWFLEHRWAQLHDHVIACPVAITHGDLNLNNVLSDERGNLYVIDFSETRERAVASDFARNEPVFLLEHAKLESEEDETRFLQDVQRCYALPADGARTVPTLPTDLVTFSAQRLAFLREQRQLAREYLGPDAPLQAWLLPLLEWTLPITLFGNQPERLRRMATWVAALQLELLQAVAQEAAENLA